MTAFLSQRYSNSDASRCRMVLPASPRRTRSSRHAMICAPGHGSKFLGPTDAGEAHKIPHGVFVGAARAWVAEIGEPFNFGRHVGQPVELGGRPQTAGGSDFCRELLAHCRRGLTVLPGGVEVANQRSTQVIHSTGAPSTGMGLPRVGSSGGLAKPRPATAR